MDDEIQRELVSAFPPTTYSMTIRGVQEGIVLADDYLSSAPFMTSPLGRDIRGQVRRIGMMFRLHEMCVAGNLPFDSSMPKMERANWHQLELRSGKFAGHLTRTLTETAFPEDRPSRQDERLQNQGDLFSSSIVPISEAVAAISRMAAWLTYRTNAKGQLLHLCWCAPAADEDDWLGFVNLLKAGGASLPASPSPAPLPDPKLRIRLHDHIREDIEKRIDRSNDNEKPEK